MIEANRKIEYSRLIDQIEAYRKSTRPDLELKIIAVSKTVSTENILPIIEKKLINFGENRIQEAENKWVELKKNYPKTKLHILGSVQRNKLRKMLEIADYYHALDRIVIIEEIARYRDKFPEQNNKIIPKLFLQVNIGSELQKSGCEIKDVDQKIKLCRKLSLPIIGLMAIPPNGQPASPYFAELSNLAKSNDLPELSMGMSNDWKQAVELGATWIRLGRIIFGSR